MRFADRSSSFSRARIMKVSSATRHKYMPLWIMGQVNHCQGHLAISLWIRFQIITLKICFLFNTVWWAHSACRILHLKSEARWQSAASELDQTSIGDIAGIR
jgi:hypothetical protein